MAPETPNSPESALPPRRARAENLEFDFGKPEKAAAPRPLEEPAPLHEASVPAPAAPTRIIIADDEDETPPKPEAPFPKRESRAQKPEPEPEPKLESKPEPPAPRREEREREKADFKNRTKDPPMSPSSFSQYQENVKRQSREQKLFGTFLNFFGYVLLAAILLVAGLAAYGGYTLSRQIQQQSLTISEMETRFNAQVASLSDALKQARDATDALEGVTQAQKQQITWLSAQLTEVRAQSKKDRDALQSRLQRVESRLFDIERKTSSSIWSR